MSNQQEKLSDFVRQIIHDKGLSYRKVADKSGGLITHSTVSDVVNERVSNLASQSIAGLAKGLGVTEQEIFALVRGKKPDEKIIADVRFAHILEMYRNISTEERLLLEPWLNALAQALENFGTKPSKEFLNRRIIQLNFNNIVRSLFEIIGKDYGLIIAEGDESEYENPFNPISRDSIYYYFNYLNNSLISIMLYRFGEYVTSDAKVNVSYLTDNDIAKLEQDLRKGIDILLENEKKLLEEYEQKKQDSLLVEMQDIDGQELATKSKKKIPLDRGIGEKKRKAG